MSNKFQSIRKFATVMKTLHLAKGSVQPTFPDNELLRLYSMKYCPYAQRAHLVLDAKNIPYHTVYVNLVNKPEWLVKVSALTKVPALETPGVTGDSLIESLVICDYLEEKYPEIPLYPRDPMAKARDKIVVQRYESILPWFMRYVFRGSPEDKRRLMEKLDVGLKVLESELKKRKTTFFGGEKPAMVDYMIWPWFERFGITNLKQDEKFTLVPFPKLSAWRDEMMKDEAVKKSFVPVEEHFRYFTTREYDFVEAKL